MTDSNLLKKVTTNPKIIESIFGNDVFNLEDVVFVGRRYLIKIAQYMYILN